MADSHLGLLKHTRGHLECRKLRAHLVHDVRRRQKIRISFKASGLPNSMLQAREKL